MGKNGVQQEGKKCTSMKYILYKCILYEFAFLYNLYIHLLQI